ncbi:hypothetical protein Clopa_4964 (plasmid) [Clostridium pasteurianum BC1]|uniref:Uncharacterized protein n=1 Tax=Clostridium pasteurianum BC1 TaxID=86416 RepID=R4KJ17_CLOPA|nr:hypothetical protein Clopa_4964 [Clostridium pasteurianum BC1]
MNNIILLPPIPHIVNKDIILLVSLFFHFLKTIDTSVKLTYNYIKVSLTYPNVAKIINEYVKNKNV